MAKFFLLLGSLSSMLAVMIGAFGAHGLKKILEENAKIEVFTRASQYHFYHSLGLLALGLLAFKLPEAMMLKSSAWAMVVGIVLFSGSLYAYAVTTNKVFVVITPIGGLAFVVAWALMAWTIFKSAL